MPLCGLQAVSTTSRTRCTLPGVSPLITVDDWDAATRQDRALDDRPESRTRTMYRRVGHSMSFTDTDDVDDHSTYKLCNE